ncbi:hypothetical protein E2C01_043855 [Portunus trituberculatus]|uniref:Uncharacterized protein n=1 Tax=Portunus trituberculatus TaxID=210409 RepID=A0A5B7FXH5_PORTR|nr:hypothetical protein [Portunus trituberculatus]
MTLLLRRFKSIILSIFYNLLLLGVGHKMDGQLSRRSSSLAAAGVLFGISESQTVTFFTVSCRNVTGFSHTLS